MPPNNETSAKCSLLLLSCSRDKEPGGAPFVSGRRTITGRLPESGADLVKGRNRILRHLKEPPGLYNADQAGGSRIERLCNQRLCLGPEFGHAVLQEARYLPAYQRYSGRFFTRLKTDAPDFWDTVAHSPVEIVFVSGLYGLVLWDELIQQYDCHVRDFVRDDRERTVPVLWGHTLTRSVCEFVRTRGIRHVYDLLSEEAYQDLFELEKVQGAKIYHRIFRDNAGPDILPGLAAIVARQFSRFCEGPRQFRNQKREGDWETADPAALGFERRRGDSLDARREGDLGKIRDELLAENSDLERLPAHVFDRLVLAEYSWRSVVDLYRFDFGALIVSFSKVAEEYLQSLLPPAERGKVGRELQKSARTKHLQERDIREVCDTFESLLKLRPAAAHPKPHHPTRDDLSEARHLTREMLDLGALHAKSQAKRDAGRRSWDG